MKRKLLVVSAFILSLGTSYGQEIMDAYKLSQTELRGTARSMSMGGAFGALGGDVSAIAINPAGIGVYKSSEIVTTLNLQNVEMKSNLNAGEQKDKKFHGHFNNLAFVGTFPLYNDLAPLLNVGFSYNRLKNFNREFRSSGAQQANSITQLMADRANRRGYAPNDLFIDDNNWYDMWRNEDWMSLMAFNGSLIEKKGSEFISSFLNGGKNVPAHSQNLWVREKGSVNSYDFNIGTTFADIVSAGLSVSVIDFDYKMSSTYNEDYFVDIAGDLTGLTLENDLRTEGTGWNVGLGVIIKPIHELRIGIAYHTPTWYNMTDTYRGALSTNLNGLTDVNNNSYYDGKVIESFDGDRYGWSETDYKLKTPDKWVFSMAGVIGSKAIISVDYELIDYGKMKYNNRHNGNDYKGVNKDLKSQYKLASTLRVGGEYRVIPQLAFRAGYSWQQNPYEKSLKNRDINIITGGSIPHYVIEGDINYITWGMGYRFTRNIYTDLAFVYKTQKSDLYTHDFAEKTKLKSNTFQGALTLGFRF